MKSNFLSTLLALGIFSAACPSASAAEDAFSKRTFSGCFLYRDAKGMVWVGTPLVSLGMIGVMAGPPKYRLSPELAERLAPLINVPKDTPDNPQFWWWDLPVPKDPEASVILIRIDTEAKKIGEEKPADGPKLGFPDGIGGFPGSAIYEIRAAKLIYAEFISPDWRRAWKSLSAGLTEIVEASLTAPGDEKTERLTKAIEQASVDFNAMVAEKPSNESAAIVRKIDPAARSVRMFQRDVEGPEIGNWGGQLREFAETLRINPATPPPRSLKPFQKVELLVGSSSPDDFLTGIKKSYPTEALYEPLIHSQHLGRVVWVWQVADLSEDQFGELKKEAKQELEKRQPEQPPSPSHSQTPFEVPGWNAVMRPADPDTLAEKGILEGTLVEEVSSEGSPAGLIAGDLILDYESVYDLVMGYHRNRERQFSGKAKYGGNLRVLRGDKMVILEVKKPE